jgi:ribosomal protein S7
MPNPQGSAYETFRLERFINAIFHHGKKDEAIPVTGREVL